jgi:drug/metabolite transporter (DMT)-like permease
MNTPANTPAQSSLLTANIICSASMLIWAAGLPAADHLIPLLTSEQLTALRMALTAAALVPFWVWLEGRGVLAHAGWLRGIAVGSLIGLGAWFLVIGQAIGGAVTAAVISATLPLVGISIEVALDGRKITAALLIGLALSLTGGMMALDWQAGGVNMGFGAAMCFASVLAFTVGSRLTVTAFPNHTPVGRTAVTLTGAAIAATVVALGQVLLGGAAPPDLAPWGAGEWGALAIYSIGAMGISQVLWIMSVGRLGIGLSSLHINAAPFYVMLILFLLGGVWNWGQAAAAGLVALGVLIAQGIIAWPKGARA